MLTNAKVAALTDGAWRLWTLGLVWAVHEETDGYIPTSALRMLHPDGKRMDLADELVRAGCWHVEGDGWRVHDFLVYQTSVADRAAKLAANARDQAAWRARQASELKDLRKPIRKEVEGSRAGP